jgi:hypothetical protein
MHSGRMAQPPSCVTSRWSGYPKIGNEVRRCHRIKSGRRSELHRFSWTVPRLFEPLA